MIGQIDHIILTRFNLPSLGAESVIRAKEGWLRERVELFEKYTIPSVRSQSNQNFRWIIYFDPESPEWLRHAIASHGSAYTPLFRESVEHDELIADMRDIIGIPRPTLITTNLDNDDGLAVDFIDTLQRTSNGHAATAVYLADGLIKSTNAVYLRHDPTNAFCSVRETWEDPRTCWADWHNLLGTTMPTVEVGGDPAWLQVIHGTNVSNRIRGRLVSPDPYRNHFPGLLDDIAVPTSSARMRDLLLSRPHRFARESSRAAVKRAAMTIGGKEGLDRAKNYLAQRSRRAERRAGAGN